MNQLIVESNPEVKEIFLKYPEKVKPKMLELRKLILNTAEELDGVKALKETLKWNEPAYITKHGSTMRIDWKSKQPDQYAMYFQCTSQLVPTFRFVFGDSLAYEGNRAVIFKLNENIPEEIVKKCICTALTYHKIKHLPTLGL